jgi:hypothetical protein
MMKQQVVVTQILVTRLGQMRYFQVVLPPGAERIIGVETSG